MARTFDFPVALVERAVDGDSLEVTCFWEMPFYIGAVPMPIRLRVAGVDCWAKETPRGAAAKARTAQLCEGKTLHVQTYGAYTYGVGTSRRLGEWMGDVLVPVDFIDDVGSSARIPLSHVLLDEGLALPYDGKGKRPTLGLPGDWPVVS